MTNPLLEIPAYKQAAIHATLAGTDHKALCWRLAADEAALFYQQSLFFAPEEMISSHKLASRLVGNQEAHYQFNLAQKNSPKSQFDWMFSKDIFTNQATSRYRYWIARSVVTSSRDFERDPSIEYLILLHRSKTVTFTASYLAALKTELLQISHNRERETSYFLTKAIYCAEKNYLLRKKILEATQLGLEENAMLLALVGASWNEALHYYRKTVGALTTKSQKKCARWKEASQHAEQAAMGLQGLVEEITRVQNRAAKIYFERALFLSKNRFDYKMQWIAPQIVFSDPCISLWKEAAASTERSCILWKNGARAASVFPSYDVIPRLCKAVALHMEYTAKEKLLKIEALSKSSVKESVAQDPLSLQRGTCIEPAFKVVESHEVPISFCLPQEALPDAACKQAWSEGRLVPRLEFTVFHCWIFQTWNLLERAGLHYTLSTGLLEPGIVITWGFYLLNTLGKNTPIPPSTFLVDVLADRLPHPGAHLYLTQNRTYAKYFPHTYFMPLWPQRLLMPRHPDRGTRFENVAFFGDATNFAPELQSEAWKKRLLEELGITFFIQGNTGWHDYRGIDAIVAVRDFSRSRHLHKPATKLYNAWLAGVPFIGGRDAAYAAEGTPGKDYLVATSLEEIVQHLRRLKEDVAFRNQLVENGRILGAAFTQEKTVERWKKLLQEIIPTHVAAWQKKSALQRRWFFFINRLICFFNYYIFVR